MTGLEWQTLSVSLAQGIDTKTDPKQVQADYLLLENAVFTATKELSLRPGFTALVNTQWNSTPIVLGNSLGCLENTLLLYSGVNSYAFIDSLNMWTQTGQKTAVTPSIDGVGTNSSPCVFTPTVAKSSNGLELYTWLMEPVTKGSASLGGISGYPYFSVYDPETKSLLTKGYVGPNSSTYYKSMRCETVGTHWFIVAVDQNDDLLLFDRPLGFPYFEELSPLFTIAAGVSDYNIDTCTSSNALYILNSGTVYSVSTALAVTVSPTSTYGNPTSSCLAFDSVNNVLWVAEATGGGASDPVANVLDASTLVSLAGPTTLTGPAIGIDADYGPVSANCSGGMIYIVGPFNQYVFSSYQASYAAGSIGYESSVSLHANGLISSKPRVRSDGSVCALLSYSSSFDWVSATSAEEYAIVATQPTNFLVKWTQEDDDSARLQVVSRSLALGAGLSFSYDASTSDQYFWACPDLLFPNNDNFITTALKLTAPAADNRSAFLVGSSTVVRSSFEFGTKLRTSALAEASHTTGGFISSYDGAVENENNFQLFPELQFDSLSGASGLANGTYSYRGVYVWTDAQGQTHRSAPSEPLTVVVSGGPRIVNLIASELNLTDKQRVTLELYRTETNGAIYYLLNQYPGDTGTAVSSFSIQDDQATPSTLQLYTTGGEVENISAPAVSFITQFKNRLFAISSENPLELWYSKQVIQSVPIEFSDLFTYALDQSHGNATALATLDDKLIIFTEEGLYYLVGDGPAPSGANNNFSYPQNIPSDSGCTEPDSIVEYPEGVFFKGSRGIYLLTRKLQVKYIGAAVEAYNQHLVTSSDIDPTLQIVRFNLDNGTSLVYDYFVEKWSVFTNIDAVASQVVNGVYYYLEPDGTVQEQVLGSFSDNGSVISMGLQSGWLSLAQIQGLQRIRAIELLGEVISACTIAVSFAYDFDETIIQTATITNTGAEDPWQWQIFPIRQRCSSMQISITVTPTVAGAGMSLSVLALEAGLKRGLNTVPASRSTS